MIIGKKFNKYMSVGLISLGLSLVSCGVEEEDDDIADSALNTIPQIQSINLSGLGNNDVSNLQSDGECDAASSAGIFGLAFGAACHTAPFAENILLGEDGGDPGGDGTVDCSDYDSSNENSGILMSLMCESWIQNNPNLVSMAFEENGSAIAASFEDFDASDDFAAVGSWTAGNTASYPANIRMWTGTSLDALSGVTAIGLSDLQNGSIYFDSSAFAGQGTAVQVDVDYSAKEDASSCTTTPSTDNCHWQEIKLYAGEDVISNGPPNGFHLKILANDVDAPTFMVLEGRFRYVDGSGFGDALSSTRQIYFQVVEQDDIVWGTFSFLDENGDAVVTGNSFVDTFLTSLSENGICSDDLAADNANNGALKTCDELGVDATVWADLFTGLSSFTNISESPIPASVFDGAPAAVGINTL